MRFCNDSGIPHSEFLEWDAADRAKTIAYMMEEAERCSMCGTADWEWEENKNAYTAVEHHCRGCMIEKAATVDKELIDGNTIRLVRSDSAAVAKLRMREQLFKE